MSWIVRNSLLVCLCVVALRAEKSVVGSSISSPSSRQLLAHNILAIEGVGDSESVVRMQLDRLIESAVARFDIVRVGEPELSKARRFFETVDRALIEGDVIFPPAGEIDFFRDGLRLRTLPETEFTRAETRFANARRLPWMRANQRDGGTFCFFDCDLASIVYVTVAERLGLPVFAVEVPGHTFVRWQSHPVTLNWDPNDGMVYPDDYYVRTWHVPSANGTWPRYFENLSRARVLSTWSVLCGREKQSRGDFEGALADFHTAVKVDPDDLGAVNELAWLLATCPSKPLRNGAEAVILAKANVAHMRRAVWLQTLAAAQAEVGDFNEAIATEEEAQRAGASVLGWVSPREILRNADTGLAIYRHGHTLGEPATAGMLVVPAH